MVKIFFHSTKLLCFTMIGFLNASGQTDQGIIFKIFSESKIISKETELHQALDVLYFGQHDQLSKRIEEDVRKNFRAISGDLEFAIIQLGSTPRTEVSERDGLLILYIIPDNIIKLRVGTWSFKLDYDVYVYFKIIQTGKMESIEVINPRVTIQNYNWYALNNGKPEVWDKMFLYTELNEAFKFTYRGLADLSFLLNDYINTSVKNNPELLKEIELDENTNLKLSAESDKVLIFKHNYTEKGMVKRNSSTEASTLITDKLEAVPIPPRKNNNAPGSTQIPTTKSTSTSPVGANKKPGVILKPRPKIGSKPVIKN